MNIDEFATITQAVIAAHGFENFQPTACFPARRSIRSLAGFPDGEDPEVPTLEWAASLADSGEEFLVASKYDASHFKVIRSVGESRDARVYAVAQQTAAGDARSART